MESKESFEKNLKIKIFAFKISWLCFYFQKKKLKTVVFTEVQVQLYVRGLLFVVKKDC